MTTHKEKGPQRGEALGAKSPPSKGPRTRTNEGNGAGPRSAVRTRLSVSPRPISWLSEARPLATSVPTLAELQTRAARIGATVRELPGDGFVAGRRGFTRELPDLASADAFLRLLGAPGGA